VDQRERLGVRWLLAGYLGLAGFFALELASRESGSASSLKASGDDAGTTRMIVIAYGLAADLPIVLRRLRRGRLPLSAGPLGLTMQAVGLGLRWWSMRTLRGSYTRTLQTAEDQQVIDRGPYRLVRHPGYLGSLLIWTGCAVASGSALTVGLVAGLLGGAYRRRIAVEEQMLRRDLPGYSDYASRTKSLIPFIW
jgi:protein-S-isoprenylcysteine O-methyltransferase Ste14